MVFLWRREVALTKSSNILLSKVTLHNLWVQLTEEVNTSLI